MSKVVRPTYSAEAKKALAVNPAQAGRLTLMLAKMREKLGFENAVVARQAQGHRTHWYGHTVERATIEARRATNKRARQARAMHRRKNRR